MRMVLKCYSVVPVREWREKQGLPKVVKDRIDSLWSSVVGYLSLEFARVQRTYVPFFALVDFFPRVATHGLRNGKKLSLVSCEN